MRYKFWMVWCPSKKEPTKRHNSYSHAKSEAERLARDNPGLDYYVLESIAHARKSDVVVTKFPVDPIPF